MVPKKKAPKKRAYRGFSKICLIVCQLRVLLAGAHAGSSGHGSRDILPVGAGRSRHHAVCHAAGADCRFLPCSSRPPAHDAAATLGGPAGRSCVRRLIMWDPSLSCNSDVNCCTWRNTTFLFESLGAFLSNKCQQIQRVNIPMNVPMHAIWLLYASARALRDFVRCSHLFAVAVAVPELAKL